MKKISNQSVKIAIEKITKLKRQSKSKSKKKFRFHTMFMLEFIEQSNNENFNLNEYKHWLRNRNIGNKEYFGAIRTMNDVLLFSKTVKVPFKKNGNMCMNNIDDTNKFEVDKSEVISYHGDKGGEKHGNVGIFKRFVLLIGKILERFKTKRKLLTN